MVTPLGKLTRLPTFKEKVREQPDNVNYGLVGYPVLMCADITLYKAKAVPVGVDQASHLEFTREIVRTFNHHFGPVLVEPQAVYTETPRVLGIDGVNKMSKSLDNHIEIASSPEEIYERVRMMVFTPQETVQQIDSDCRTAGIGCVDCKKMFAKNLADYFAPFRERRARLAENPDEVWEVLHRGAEKAGVIASQVIDEVKGAVGLP
jgi:tryptophanyl-tRNA synthetase